jgi:hypothetical protein
MKFMRLTTRDISIYHRRNEDVLDKIKVNPVEKKSPQYK